MHIWIPATLQYFRCPYCFTELHPSRLPSISLLPDTSRRIWRKRHEFLCCSWGVPVASCPPDPRSLHWLYFLHAAALVSDREPLPPPPPPPHLQRMWHRVTRAPFMASSRSPVARQPHNGGLKVGNSAQWQSHWCKSLFWGQFGTSARHHELGRFWWVTLKQMNFLL